jgi:predicted Zn-dependent protease
MNPSDDFPDNRLEEQQVRDLLAAADRNLAPPDPAFLDRLREQSTEVFLASTRHAHSRFREVLMNSRPLRLLACAAALLIVAVGAFWYLRARDSEPAFGQVLERVARVQTVHLRLTQGDRAYEMWAERPGRLRRNAPDGTYQIARDGKLWSVDEKANRAAVRPSPYHRSGERHELDLLALLPLPVKVDQTALAGKQPVGRTERDGLDCLVYRLEVPAEEGDVEVEALVDRRTGLPHELQARGVRDGQRQTIAELKVLGYDESVPAEQFVVRDTLTEDGRVGKVTDVQGVVTVKPVMHERWTPVVGRIPVKPGDWLRTDVRGANAAAVRLVKDTRLVLGPGTVVEVVKPDRVRLISGQVEVTAPKGSPLELDGPSGEKAVVKGTERYRVDREKLTGVPQEPTWLKAFKGTTNNESLGSLVAGVDGRNVPLSVGEHRVSVDIRDQIARTTVEETFVNHTGGVLEGTFHFPLPAGASVSGFAMWIGDRMVEADIVEKQRAREIFEIILHEKRDPGLLEWTGGNIFKARVYPIFAHSEKRVRITYTQVLPLRGGSYHYSYALQSEMLVKHPLRELAIDLRIHSATPLKAVSCPTHAARLDRTTHSAHVEFTAQEYVPTRDFEVTVEVGDAPPVVVVPHRRGEDGYFMVQIAPPGGEESGRALLPDGDPLDLVIVADTSASMDAKQRLAQAALLSALLSALTPRDTFNLAACDVECDWAFEKSMPATPSNGVMARDFLARRRSLGWTNLDQAFASALARCGPKTHLIYLGDGIVTTGNADPGAFSKRLRKLYEEKGRRGTCHAVATGSSYETGVLQTIAALGGGSVRHVTAERGPAAVALELLGEISRPVLRDLKVEFRGLRTASVYPEQLPNLPPGEQHVVLGRYLPEGRNQVGEVIVTGTRGGEAVRFSAPVVLREAEDGNSFLPRLWARMRLDHLLAQGSSAAGRDEIIALSEEFNILTPYTSLLVLESDADRERFGVKKRFRMRDGERFFAKGRDDANFELKQQQMKRAGDWRLGLRRQVLRQLAGMGRDSRRFQENLPLYLRDAAEKMAEMDAKEVRLGGLDVRSESLADEPPVEFPASAAGDFKMASRLDERSKAAEEVSVPGLLDPLSTAGGEGNEDDKPLDFLERRESEGEGLAQDWEGGERPFGEVSARRSLGLGGPAGGFGMMGMGGGMMGGIMPMGGKGEWGYFGRARRGPRPRSLVALFPNTPPMPTTSKKKSAWPAEVRALAQGLLRPERLGQGGVEVVGQEESLDVRWGDVHARSRKQVLLSAAAWLTRIEADGQQTSVDWWDGRERGDLSLAFGLARIRAAADGDRTAFPFDLADYSLLSLERFHGNHAARIEPRKDGLTLLVLTHPSDTQSQTHILIDTGRHVIVGIEERRGGKTTERTKFEDFVEAAGCWWARRIETTDGEGRVVSRTTRTIQALTADQMAKRMKEELAARESAIVLHHPAPTRAAAKQAVAAGKPTFDDRFTLLLHFAAGQQWARAAEQLRECDRLAAGKPGLRWLHDEFLLASRRHEKLRKRLLDDAGRLAKSASTDEQVVANHLLARAREVLEANERLALLDVLKPIFARQPAHRHALKSWMQERMTTLQQAGQSEEALRLQKQLAADWPHDADVQEQYARGLASAGDYPAAYACLERALAGDNRWLPREEESLRNTYAQFLETQGRFADLASYLAAWLKKEPASSSPYAQYLSALIWADQLDRANALAARWLREGQIPGSPAPAVEARLQAAISLALGQGHNFQPGRVEERWLTPLAEAALFFSRHEDRISDADLILSAWQLRQTDAYPRVRKALFARLTAEAGTLSPALMHQHVLWIGGPQGDAERVAWKQLASTLRKRRGAEPDTIRKHLLGLSLAQVLSQINDPAEYLAFLRERLQKGAETDRAGHAAELFDALLAQPWSAQAESEALGLLDKLSDAASEPERLGARVAALHRLTDRMIEARRQAAMQAVEHPEKLTRTELHKKQEEILRLARIGLADSLKTAEARAEGQLAAWLKIERIYLDVRLERDLPRVTAECWEFLDRAPRKSQEPSQLEEMLRERYLLTLMNLAARKGAEPALADRLRKYLERGAALEDEEAVACKRFEYLLLIALDRPKDLEKTLRAWIAAGDPDSRWRLALGYVLAEQGRVPEAIKELEAIEASDELGPTAYRALADWYLAANRREQYERASLAAWKTAEEWQLQRILQARLWPWQQDGGHPPTEVDREVLFQFAALFEKSSNPQNHLELLRQFYELTHDFRLLAGMADAVVGHSAAGIYPFLMQTRSVLAEIGDEATVDELATHLARVRTLAKTEVDRRALDLLEMQVRRRAAELKNQPGPHAEAALAALKRAFKGEWSPGEAPQMADLLAGLGTITPEPLAKEQRRQLVTLHALQAKGSFDRLHIAQRLAETLAGYEQRDQAIALLQMALAEYQEAHAGVLPPTANNALNALVSLLENGGQHDRGEKVLLDQLRRPAHEEQRYWLTFRLHQLYHKALSSDGTVSFGSGVKLYQEEQRKLLADLPAFGGDHRRDLINLLCSLYTTAHGKKFPGIGDDLKAFASGPLPALIRQDPNQSQNIVGSVAQTMRTLVGPRDGIEFFLDQIDREPKWLRVVGQDTWSRHNWTIAQWRTEVKDGGELEKRLLPLVLADLRRDLETRQQRSRVMSHRQNSYFWAEKEEDFAQVAEAVLAARPQSGATASYVAEYLYRGLGRTARGIAVLTDAHKKKLLDEAAQIQLVQFLHEQNRHAESIPLLEPLVQRLPEDLNCRILLMSAYHHTNRPADLLALLKKTDALFHDKGRWTEDVMARLAASCLDNKLHAQAVAYCTEVIALHQRTAPRRGIGDGVLSNYYVELAQAQAALGKTAEAVEAAGGAVVSWGPAHANRAQALETLRQVLRTAPDLDGYVASVDRQAAASGLDSAVVRKALGQVYLEKGVRAKAIAQLQLAISLQPADADTQRLLIDCYDKEGDGKGAIAALLEAVQTSRRDLSLYRSLGDRLKDQPKEAERAYTSLVEVLPNESEGHAMLAEVRQGQNRWPEAIAEWEQVVRIRSLEPAGLLKLAAAQVHENQWEQAAQTVSKLEGRTWAPRFGDVAGEVRKLREQIKDRKPAPQKDSDR